jgi:hypothetical protein
MLVSLHTRRIIIVLYRMITHTVSAQPMITVQKVRLLLLLLCGAGDYPPNVLQHTVAYCTNPALVPPSTPEALHIRRRDRPLLARAGTIGEK